DMTFMLCKSLNGFPDYDAGEQKQQSGFGKRRNRLYLAVPVVVFFIRWLARNTHGDIGHHGGAEINKRMASLRQDRQRTGGKADDCFGYGQSGRSDDRGKCNLFFFALPAASVQRNRRHISRTDWNSATHSRTDCPSFAAERLTASRMRILARSCSIV